MTLQLCELVSTGFNMPYDLQQVETNSQEDSCERPHAEISLEAVAATIRMGLYLHAKGVLKKSKGEHDYIL